MALSVPASGALRISQILPTIKCSKCNEDINIHYADEHVCNSNPTLSSPTRSPGSQEPLSRVIDRASTASSISAPSVSSYSTQSRSSRSSTSTKRAPSVRSTHTIQQSPPATLPLRPQYKSTASFQSFRSQSSVDDATGASPPPRSGPSPAPTVRSNPASSPVDGGATSPVQRSGPSPTLTVRSNPPLPPRSTSPSPSSRAPSRMMAASPAPSIPPSRTPEPPVVLPPVAPLVLRKFSRSSKESLPPQLPPPTHAPPPPDTSTGGEAGMAGVGRRAFAAAAHAALFTGHSKYGLPSPGLSPTSMFGYPGQIMSSPISPDGRLSSLSGYLNISTDVTGGTPPLSPSYSPGSPSSATRPRSPSDDVHSPGAEIARTPSRSPSPDDVIDGSGERSKGKGVAGGLSSLARQLRKDAANSPTAPRKNSLCIPLPQSPWKSLSAADRVSYPLRDLKPTLKPSSPMGEVLHHHQSAKSLQLWSPRTAKRTRLHFHVVIPLARITHRSVAVLNLPAIRPRPVPHPARCLVRGASSNLLVPRHLARCAKKMKMMLNQFTLVPVLQKSGAHSKSPLPMTRRSPRLSP
ncbi:hypothetical protein RSOL_404960 [Rhizoctonia solani AG-3 Rhs1AP]|uniref:Uncharacterized protein n=1 Tax=Rhizoctonia solani AG-3 Rhs1AP TaxID=1086054 RepID=X8JD94_9AGAM|nr:hypothetical protein RSOL_404960 [Rhizoctonia solani AG-3 Rhs1AP]